MTAERKPEAKVLDLSNQNGELKPIGGSMSDDWNRILAHQVSQTLWFFHNTPKDETRRDQFAALAGLVGIGPRDELEGMLAAQLLASHNASMECYRRAIIRDQTFEGRQENLNQANKLSRTFTTLLDALNRHRGKGQQKVTVEHVHVHAGAQAVVGMVQTPGGGEQSKSQDQPHARQITHASQPPVWSADKERQPVPVASNEEWSLSDARRLVAGRSTRK